MSNYICNHPSLIKSKINSCDGNERYICTKCNQEVIKSFFDHCTFQRNDNTLCAHCGVKRRNHYTYHHMFKSLCNPDTGSPFDVSDRPIQGYDKYSRKFYPPSLQ